MSIRAVFPSLVLTSAPASCGGGSQGELELQPAPHPQVHHLCGTDSESLSGEGSGAVFAIADGQRSVCKRAVSLSFEPISTFCLAHLARQLKGCL